MVCEIGMRIIFYHPMIQLKFSINYFLYCKFIRYENADPVVRFTEAQLTEIRKTTMAKIVCENLDYPGDMQRAAFDLPSNFL
jgi:Animal haem peroxidase